MSTVRVMQVLVVVGAAVMLAASCTLPPDQQDAESPRLFREVLYEDVGELAGDSAAVVVGHVSGQRVVADVDPAVDFTLSTVEVTEVLSGDVEVGEPVVVRQLGSSEQPAPVELMASGQEYLLYLTESGLDGPLAGHFYVTGANAGLYARSQDVFVQVDREEGEDLPGELTLDGALG